MFALFFLLNFLLQDLFPVGLAVDVMPPLSVALLYFSTYGCALACDATEGAHFLSPYASVFVVAWV